MRKIAFLLILLILAFSGSAFSNVKNDESVQKSYNDVFRDRIEKKIKIPDINQARYLAEKGDAQGQCYLGYM